MVLATIQNGLRGKPVPSLEPRVDVLSPLTEEVSPIVSGFINEISKMYKRELGEQNNASQEIKGILDPAADPIERYKKLSKEFSGAVLASHGKHRRHYIGSACLRPYEGPTATKEQPELELCYLFVLKAFRNLKIASYILHQAHQAAKKQGYTALVFEALPEYFEAILYLQQRGFTPTDRQGRKGRIVLKYSTTRAFPFPKKEGPLRNDGPEAQGWR